MTGIPQEILDKIMEKGKKLGAKPGDEIIGTLDKYDRLKSVEVKPKRRQRPKGRK